MNVKSVSDLSGLVHETNQAIQWLHQGGPGKEKMVPADVLAASASIVRAAIDTVATSFVLFQLMGEVSREANLNVRMKAMETFEEQLKSKGIPIGKDMREKMDDLKSCKYVPPKPDGRAKESAKEV